MSDDNKELAAGRGGAADLHHIVIAPLALVTEYDQMLIDLEEYRRDVERLRAENERLTADGIHTCHEQCQRYACVLRRERDAALSDVERLKGDLSVANLRIEAKEKYSAKKNELADRLIEWAQNNEMIDNKYTNHGKDCLEAAKLLKEFN